MTFSVHDEPDFERTYDEDEIISIRKGDLRALLDLATGSMDFGSGFWDNEQVEIARKTAVMLDIDPMLVTPSNFVHAYGHAAHQWVKQRWGAHECIWYCEICRHTAGRNSPTPPSSEVKA